MEEREEGVAAAEAWGWAATSSVEVLRGEGGEGLLDVMTAQRVRPAVRHRFTD